MTETVPMLTLKINDVFRWQDGQEYKVVRFKRGNRKLIATRGEGTYDVPTTDRQGKVLDVELLSNDTPTGDDPETFEPGDLFACDARETGQATLYRFRELSGKWVVATSPLSGAGIKLEKSFEFFKLENLPH